jgi:hypothetical protein
LFTPRIIARNARSTCAQRDSGRPTIPFQETRILLGAMG